MIDWLTKQISKKELLDNNSNSKEKELKKAKQLEEQDLGRENTHDYIRKNTRRIHYIDDD
jgi:hypothetical protein